MFGRLSGNPIAVLESPNLVLLESLTDLTLSWNSFQCRPQPPPQGWTAFSLTEPPAVQSLPNCTHIPDPLRGTQTSSTDTLTPEPTDEGDTSTGGDASSRHRISILIDVNCIPTRHDVCVFQPGESQAYSNTYLVLQANVKCSP